MSSGGPGGLETATATVTAQTPAPAPSTPQEEANQPSIEMAILRAGAVVVAVTGFLWQLESITRSIPREEFWDHWFPFASLLVFLFSNTILLVAVAVNTRRALIAALRVPIYLMLGMLAMVSTYADVAHTPIGNALWYSPFAGLAVVAFALTVPLSLSLSLMAFVPGLVAVFNSWLLGHTQWLEMLSDVGFNLINSFPFVIIAGSARPVARLIDETYARSHKVAERAERVRVRGEAMSTFTAYVHDYVLAALSALAKGTPVNFSLDEQTGQFFPPGNTVEAQRFATKARSQVASISEDMQMAVTITHPQTPVQLPGEVANTLLLAIAEVVRNVEEHAGAAEHKMCALVISPGEVEITVTDTGPGFRVADIDPHRAGLRLSVQARMTALRGGDAAVESQPGEGTKVSLSWRGDTSVLQEKDQRTAAPAWQTSLYHLMGLSVVFSWQFYVAIMAILTIVTITNEQFYTSAGQWSLACASVVLALLMVGRDDQLPLSRTIAVALLLVVLTVVGTLQPIPNEIEWSYYWHFNTVALFLTLFAVRSRPWWAVGTWIATLIAVEVSRIFTLSSNDLGAMDLLIRSVIVVAGIMASTMLNFLWPRVPQSMAAYNQSLFIAGAAEEFERSSQDNFEWLQRQVAPIFTAANALERPTRQLQKRAALTEKRLRDVLRSPRLNHPALHAAVWDARSRGIEVRLLDDRRHAPITDVSDVRQFELVDEDAAVTRLLPEFLRALDNADTGTVTIRLLPPGRRAFASISDAAGVHRFSAEGSRIQPQRPAVEDSGPALEASELPGEHDSI